MGRGWGSCLLSSQAAPGLVPDTLLLSLESPRRQQPPNRTRNDHFINNKPQKPSLLRCKGGSPRRLGRGTPSGTPPCEICACLHYHYFILETTNYFISPDLHTNIKAEAIPTPYNLIILHYSAGEITSKPGSALPPRLLSLRDSASSGPGKSPSAAKASFIFFFALTHIIQGKGDKTANENNINVYMVILHCFQILSTFQELARLSEQHQGSPSFIYFFFPLFLFLPPKSEIW